MTIARIMGDILGFIKTQTETYKDRGEKNDGTEVKHDN